MSKSTKGAAAAVPSTITVPKSSGHAFPIDIHDARDAYPRLYREFALMAEREREGLASIMGGENAGKTPADGRVTEISGVDFAETLEPLEGDGDGRAELPFQNDHVINLFSVFAPQDAARDGQRHRRRERLQAEPRHGRGAGGHTRPEGQDGADPPAVRPGDGHEGPRPARDAELWRPAPAEVDFRRDGQGIQAVQRGKVRRRVRRGRRSSKDDQRALQGVPDHAQVDEEDDRRARRDIHVQLHSDPEGRQVQGELGERREAQVRRRRRPGRSQVGEKAEAPDRGGAADGQGERRRGRSRRPGRVRLLRRAPGEDPGLPRPGRRDEEEPLRRAREHQQQQPRPPPEGSGAGPEGELRLRELLRLLREDAPHGRSAQECRQAP
ncbi:hypothetical protein THAOC_09768 [Thalassiosira oceanica]|uniref:Uncharacterized protein n=1 Tax=Thalassiosira oceanica TaxID=159749 RepID=K0SRR8_THAOC|nr:hypothetical protein THAOC_09768 [Thalassiosira oceanica]|eukprot:EJK69018.1 hypothetical protein THAOC_09768 [Thalassiosira oceanica]